MCFFIVISGKLEVLSDDSESCFDLIDSTGQIKNIQDESSFELKKRFIN